MLSGDHGRNRCEFGNARTVRPLRPHQIEFIWNRGREQTILRTGSAITEDNLVIGIRMFKPIADAALLKDSGHEMEIGFRILSAVIERNIASGSLVRDRKRVVAEQDRKSTR